MTSDRKNMTKRFFLRLKYNGWRYLTASFLNWRFPFLRFAGDKWFANASWYYQIPEGWRKRFGYKMCRELYKELKRWNYVRQYKIMDIKEKYGSLRWSDNGVPEGSKIFEILSKYERLSFNTCIVCGRKAEYLSDGWVCPYCKRHIKGKRMLETIDNSDFNPCVNSQNNVNQENK